MKTKTTTIKLALLAGVLAAATGAAAQGTYIPRAHHSEFYLLLQYWTADNANIPNVTLPTGIGPGAPVATSDINYKLKDTFFYGFGFAYNFTDYVAVRFEESFGWPDYDMTWNNARLSGQSFVNTGKLNVDINLMKGPITPFVSAGIGYFYIDTGVPSGPPEYFVWWDYWWGPVGVVTQPTFTETYFTYNAAVGVRWDLDPHQVVRLMVAGNWLDNSGKAGTIQTIETTISYSWKW